MSKQAIPEMAFDVSSSDDDEAPEEVSVTSSRQQGISQLKDLKESLRKSKEEERDRRRQRNEKFRIQKEQKLKDLSKRKLPEDVLEAISAKSAKKAHENEEKAITRSNEDGDDVHSEEEGKSSDRGDDDLSDSGVEGSVKSYSAAEEFIPLGTGSGLTLVTPGGLLKTVQTAAEKALIFKQNRLYDQQIPRENVQQRRAKVAKRIAVNQKK